MFLRCKESRTLFESCWSVVQFQLFMSLDARISYLEIVQIFGGSTQVLLRLFKDWWSGGEIDVSGSQKILGLIPCELQYPPDFTEKKEIMIQSSTRLINYLDPVWIVILQSEILGLGFYSGAK